MPAEPTRPRLAVAVAGTLAVTAVAAFLGWLILVVTPLASAPGLTLAEVHAAMAAANESIDPPLVLALLAVGPLLALALLVATVRSSWPPEAVAAAYLGPLAFSAPASAVLGFGPGMALGDTFGSAAFTWWEIVPALVSALALAGVVKVGFRTGRGRPGRGARRTGRPAPSTP